MGLLRAHHRRGKLKFFPLELAWKKIINPPCWRALSLSCSACRTFGRSIKVEPFLSQPTLVMAGTDDSIVPVVNGRIPAKLIPDARLVTVDDGHLFLLTSAKTSTEAVADFLE